MERKTHIKSSKFSEYIASEQIVFDLKAKDKIQALEELLDNLAELKLIKNKKPILTRIIDRERLESTAIGHGVALPHARIDTGHDIAVAVGRSEQGIEFDAVDKQPVHLIILVVWNPTIPGLFNHLFAGMAKFLMRSRFRDRLMTAQNAVEMFEVLSEIELHLPQQEDKIIHRANVLWKLQEIEIQKKNVAAKGKTKLDKHAALLREELDAALLDRFDKLMERYGFAVTEVDDGVCQGCYINVATQMSSAIEGSNDIYVCENCGKFLVSSKSDKD